MSDKVYPVVYRKAIKGSVGGAILLKRGEGYVESEYLLRGDPATTDPDSLTIEIPDEVCEKFFIKHNKPAIQNGYLIEVSDYSLSLNSANAVSDGYMKDLLKEPFTKFKKRVLEFTSIVPVTRLLDMATETNQPVKTIEFLKETIAKLESKPKS